MAYTTPSYLTDWMRKTRAKYAPAATPTVYPETKSYLDNTQDGPDAGLSNLLEEPQATTARALVAPDSVDIDDIMTEHEALMAQAEQNAPIEYHGMTDMELAQLAAQGDSDAVPVYFMRQANGQSPIVQSFMRRLKAGDPIFDAVKKAQPIAPPQTAEPIAGPTPPPPSATPMADQLVQRELEAARVTPEHPALAAIVPKIAPPEQLETDPLKLLGDVGRPVAAMLTGLAELPLATAAGIMDIPGIKQAVQATQWGRDVRDNVGAALDTLAGNQAVLSEEAKKAGGLPAEIAQNIATKAMTAAANLAMLNISGFVGKGATLKQAAIDAGKMAALAYAQTPGDNFAKLKQATIMAAFMLTPIPAGMLPKDWQAKVANVAENVILSGISGGYGAEVPTADAASQLAMDVAFGAVVKGRGGKIEKPPELAKGEPPIPAELTPKPIESTVLEPAPVVETPVVGPVVPIITPKESVVPIVEQPVVATPITTRPEGYYGKMWDIGYADARQGKRSRADDFGGFNSLKYAVYKDGYNSFKAEQAKPSPAVELPKEATVQVAAVPERRTETPIAERPVEKPIIPAATPFPAKPEVMTPEQRVEKLERDADDHLPLNIQDVALSPKMRLPEGYVREGDRYVFKGEPAPAQGEIATEPVAEPAPTAEPQPEIAVGTKVKQTKGGAATVIALGEPDPIDGTPSYNIKNVLTGTVTKNARLDDDFKVSKPKGKPVAKPVVEPVAKPPVANTAEAINRAKLGLEPKPPTVAPETKAAQQLKGKPADLSKLNDRQLEQGLAEAKSQRGLVDKTSKAWGEFQAKEQAFAAELQKRQTTAAKIPLGTEAGKAIQEAMGTGETKRPSAPEGGVKKGPGLSQSISASTSPSGADIISTRDVAEQIVESFGMPLRVGRFRQKASGIYKDQPEVARTKVYGDISVATHEAAHHLENKTTLIQAIPATLKAEVARLDYEPAKRRVSEGFAEYLRMKLTTDNEAATKAPGFDAWFDNTWLPAHPEWQSKIADVKKIVTGWRREGSINRVKAQINKESTRFQTLKTWVQNPKQFFQGIYDAALNRQAPLWRAQAAIAGTKKLADIPAEYRFAQAAKVLNMSAPAKVRQMVLSGMTDVTGNKTGASLKDALDPINDSLKTPEGQREFEAYLYARHAIDVRKANKESGISQEDARFTVDELGKRPGWTKAANGVSKWFDGLLDYLIDAGGLTPEAKAKMKALYPNYIPLFRAMEGTQKAGGGKGIADIPSPMQRLKGSGRQIISPLENAIVQGERIVGVADKIRIGRMMADASEHYSGAGKIIEKVSPGMTASSATVETLKSQLKKAGIEFDSADMDSVISIYENVYRGSSKDNVIVLWRKGKQEMYQVDPDVYRALTNLDQQFQLPKVVDWIFGKPTRLLRLSTTGLRAGFSMITNPLRDLFTSVMQTRTKGYAGSLPGKVADNIAGIMHDIMGTEAARLFKAGGGEMGQPLAIDRVFTQEAVSELLAKTPKQKILNWSKHPIESARKGLSITELGSRLGEFERILKQKGWKEGQPLTLEQYLDAQMAASDVTVDFRQGGWLGMWMNRITAFHNASVQGPLQFSQAFQRNAVGTTAKGLLWLTLPTIGLWWQNKDKQWYKDLPAYEKYGYWHIEVGDTVLRIPRPFEWGVVFASIPEAMLEAAYAKDPSYINDVIGQSFQMLAPPVVPTAAAVPAETFFNWDTFRRRPIVSKGMEYMKPEDRSYTTTTETAKQLGHLFGVSPAKIEFLAGGFTGGLSTEAVRAVEGLVSGKASRPKELADLPVVGRLFLRPNTTKRFDEFYVKAEELNQEFASAKFHGKTMAWEAQAKRRAFNSTITVLSDLRKEAKQVIENMNLSSSAKRTKLQDIQDRMLNAVENPVDRSGANLGGGL